MNSKIIKQLICKYITNNPGCVKKLWNLPNNIDEIELTNPNIWKRNFKEKHTDKIVRYFDPRGSKNDSIADQLQAEVITNITDTIVLSITIEA